MKSYLAIDTGHTAYRAEVDAGVVGVHRSVGESAWEKVWEQEFDTRNANFGQMVQLSLDRLLDAIRDDIQAEEKALQERRRALDLGRR